MDKQQIEKWGYEADNHADVVIAMPGEYHPDWHIVRDEYFASMVAAHEREQCALACEALGRSESVRGVTFTYAVDASECATEIRKRNNQESK